MNALIALTIVLSSLSAVITPPTWNGQKANSHLALVVEKEAKEECATTNTGDVVCTPAPMQDLSQCTYATATGELICVDICGGMSAPGAVCSYE